MPLFSASLFCSKKAIFFQKALAKKKKVCYNRSVAIKATSIAYTEKYSSGRRGVTRNLVGR